MMWDVRRFALAAGIVFGAICTSGCGMVGISLKYTPSGALRDVAQDGTKATVDIRDERGKKVFFKTALGNTTDTGSSGLLKLNTPPCDVFKEGFIDALQQTGVEMRGDTGVVYEAVIKRFLAIDATSTMQSDIYLEVAVRKGPEVYFSKSVFERSEAKPKFWQVWQDSVPAILNPSLSAAIEDGVWDADVIAAIERANGLTTSEEDVVARMSKSRLERPTAAREIPALNKPITASRPSTGSSQRSSSSPFTSTYVRGLGPPEVLINNQSGKTITLALSGPESYTFNVEAHYSDKVTIKAGTYSFTGSATGVSPCSGTETFQTDNRYTWTFIITTYPGVPMMPIVRPPSMPNLR
jgi:hypothetical protein